MSAQKSIISGTMNKLQKETVKARILKLASLKSTGTPLELANRLDISDRSVKRLIKEIRDEGIAIRYCHVRRSYVTEEPSG
jgi:biotin operon repressor